MNKFKVLQLFFNNPITEGLGFQLREISRNVSLAPTSVKNYLIELEKEGLVLKKKHRANSYPTYFANRDNERFIFLKKLNNIQLIKDSGLLNYIEYICMPDVIILFGSYSKGEDLKDSDIDIFLLCNKTKLDLRKYEKKLNRKINIFFCKSFGKLSKELKNNIINGVILKGYLKVF
jgi:predicted nucleotidyltransferase